MTHQLWLLVLVFGWESPSWNRYTCEFSVLIVGRKWCWLGTPYVSFWIIKSGSSGTEFFLLLASTSEASWIQDRMPQELCRCCKGSLSSSALHDDNDVIGKHTCLGRWGVCSWMNRAEDSLGCFMGQLLCIVVQGTDKLIPSMNPPHLKLLLIRIHCWLWKFLEFRNHSFHICRRGDIPVEGRYLMDRVEHCKEMLLLCSLLVLLVCHFYQDLNHSWMPMCLGKGTLSL